MTDFALHVFCKYVVFLITVELLDCGNAFEISLVEYRERQNNRIWLEFLFGIPPRLVTTATHHKQLWASRAGKYWKNYSAEDDFILN